MGALTNKFIHFKRVLGNQNLNHEGDKENEVST